MDHRFPTINKIIQISGKKEKENKILTSLGSSVENPFLSEEDLVNPKIPLPSWVSLFDWLSYNSKSAASNGDQNSQ
jgi:hypothetical protein